MGFLAPLNRPIRNWDGQRVWIVGASSGIGAALARALAGRGAWVALSARRRDALEEVAASCGGEALVEPMDVTSPADFERVRDRLLAAWGRLDLVVFNAGTYRPLRADQITPASIRETLHTNLIGMMDGVAAVVPLFTRQGRGGVALVGSVAGYGGLPKATVYGPGKAALINFAETLYRKRRSCPVLTPQTFSLSRRSFTPDRSNRPGSKSSPHHSRMAWCSR